MESMTREDAKAAIEKASSVLVRVVRSKSYLGADGHTGLFGISKEEALAAMDEIDDMEFEPNIEISKDQATVTIGTGWQQTFFEDRNET